MLLTIHCVVVMITAAAPPSGAWAVVTGASSGIGWSIALEAAARGYNVVVAARRKRELAKLVAEILRYGVDALPVVVDLARLSGAAKLHRATRRLGSSVELVVFNAGFASAGDVIASDPSSINQMVAVNMGSVAILSRLYGADLAAAGKGAILLTSSLTALAPLPRAAVYAASRAFVHSLADSLATELTPYNVRVRCLLPGSTDSGFAAVSGTETSLAFNGPLFRPLGVLLSAEQVAVAALTSVDQRPWPPLRAPYWAHADVEVYASFLQRCYAFAARALMPRSLAGAFASAFFDAASPLASASALAASLPVMVPAALSLVVAIPLTALQLLLTSLPWPLLVLLLIILIRRWSVALVCGIAILIRRWSVALVCGIAKRGR